MTRLQQAVSFKFLESSCIVSEILRNDAENYCIIATGDKNLATWGEMWSEDDDYFSYSPYYFGSDMDDSDVDEYFDDDDYCGYSSGENYSSLMLAARRARAQAEGSDDASTAENISTTIHQVRSLQDSCCRFIALKFPFAYVEHRSPPIPDELQLKIIGFSFPEDEEMIRKYAEFSRSSVDFNSAKRMLENGNVNDLNQIGTVGVNKYRPQYSVCVNRPFHIK